MRNVFKLVNNLSKICSGYMYKRSSLINFRKCYCSAYNIDLKISEVSLKNYIAQLEEEYKRIKTEPEKEGRISELKPIIDILEERKSLLESISNLSELLNEKDEDIRKLAEEEKALFVEKIQEIDEELREALLPVDEDESCNSIVLEVYAGVGGQEAMLFAGELFEMYSSFAEHKGWEVQTAEFLTSDLGGLRHGSLLLKGPAVFRYFKYEAGVHRVQRVPATEKSGRIHTSTVSVLALPQPTDIQIQLNNKDLKIETKRATGAGGQHVNTTDSAVRILHIPTGVAVECQVDRSQIRNKEMAIAMLRAKLYQIKLDEQIAESTATRKSQVRSNFRNEKIRTYNFSQDRITDHRLQSSNVHNLRGFLTGGEALEQLINKLHRQSQINILLQNINDMYNK